ncbi:MAG: penicillin-binding protein activator [Deltaproteobacteria bacterium]|nr:penicillin-binding protein activator [Deltaproteobacteria bacterium]
MRFGVLGFLLLLGCASTQASADKPLEPLPPAQGLAGIGGAGDPGGDADFRVVANRAANVYDPGARASLEAFLLHHPHHHQRPAAAAMLIGVLLLQGDAPAAKTVLDDNTAYLPAAEREFFDGLCAGQLLDHARALSLLQRYLGAAPPLGMGGLPDPDVRRLLRSTLAESLFALGNPGDAIDQLELYAQIEGNRPAERIYAVKRAQEFAVRVAGPAAVQALVGRRGLLARAVLGQKAVAALRARGDKGNADRLEREVMGIRRQLGFERQLPSAIAADPLRLGLVVPLSGAQARLGEVILRGAALVITAATHAANPVQFHLLLRDAATGPERSPLGGGTSAGILGLAREEKVIGVVSTPDTRGAEYAAREGIPVVLLDERSGGGQSTAFAVIHAAETRAVTLARRALALGARRFAILGPDTGAGKRLSAAFRGAVERGGGSLTAYVTYAPGATTFANEIANLRRLPFDALYIPDNAARLELIAPALAVADIWPRSPRLAFSSARSAATSGPGRRESLLLSTALGISAKSLRNVERYVQGTMLCPGFYPGEDTRSASFISRFKGLYGTSPTATDAYGYDALFLLRGAVERGARTRADVLRVLGTQTFEGLTGDIRFGPDRSRIDPPLVYVVDGESVRILK